MRNIITVYQRELRGYFATPVAYVFLIVFLILSGFLTWGMGGQYERDQADLQAFFGLHPWLYLALVPAITMRVWAEERRGGTIELLLTLPISMGQAVVGKFLAAWIFTGIALLLTFPTWLSVAYLGDPDNGVILASYIGSFLMAGAYLAVGCAISALTKNQVIAFVLTLVLSLLVFVLPGVQLVRDFIDSVAPPFLAETIMRGSFLNRFTSITRGVIEARDVLFFGSVLALFLYANSVFIDLKKAE